MSNRTWMPLHIDAYLADTGHLTAMEHGAYMLLIMHYWREGGLPADERLIARLARLNAEQWAESRDVLAELFQDGWTHKRIDTELAKADEIIAKRKAAAEQMHSKRHAKADALAEQVQSTCSDTRGYTSNLVPTPSGSKEPSGVRPRATRLSPDWKPSDEDLAYARGQGVPQSAIDREEQKFRNYWVGKSGKDATKLDWSATWRNWVLRTCEQGGYAPASEAGPTAEHTTVWVTDDDPRWPRVAERYVREKGRSPPTKGLNGKNGLGWYFPKDWVEAA